MFKLILGLGNKDINSIKNITETYAQFGIDMIDCAANSILEIQENFKQKNINTDNILFCVSVALFGDVHNKKAKINKNCSKCSSCEKICSQKAIKKNEDKLRVDAMKCTGCSACRDICKFDAIDIYEERTLYDDIELIKNKNIKIDVLEVHLSVKKKKEILRGFEYICKNYRGNISVCISRKYFGGDKIIKILARLKDIFDKYNSEFEFFVQADGSSINNACSEYSSNLEAMAFFKELSNTNYKIIISGGLNSRAVELAKLFNLKPYGMAFGSYARKLLKDDINAARELVLSVKEYLS